MLRDNKTFTGVLTSIGSKAIDEEVVTTFKIRHIEEGEVQVFLDSYEGKCGVQNIKSLFNCPVAWKSIKIEAGLKFKVEFDEVEFEALLNSIKVNRSYKKGIEVFTYDLEFQKEMDKDVDVVFSTYLNQKEEDSETGKRALIKYDVYLTPMVIKYEN